MELTIIIVVLCLICIVASLSYNIGYNRGKYCYKFTSKDLKAVFNELAEKYSASRAAMMLSTMTVEEDKEE